MKIFKKNIDYSYFLLIFLLIYMGSNTLFTQIILSTQKSAYLVFAISVVLCILKNKSRIKVRKYSVQIVAILTIFLFATLIINVDMDNFNGYFLIFLKIVSAVLLLICLDYKRFLKTYTAIMYILAIASLIVTYILPIFSLEKLLPEVINRMDISFYNGFLAFKIDSYGTFAIRNYGIFSEPAVYSFYLFIALIFIFTNEKITYKTNVRVCILLIAIVTTFSPIGFITAICVCLLWGNKVVKSDLSPIAKLVPVFLLILVFIMFLIIPQLNDGFNYVVSKTSIASGTGEGRLNCIIFNLKKWLENPAFGGGLKEITKISLLLGYNTSTTGTLLSGFGIFFSFVVSSIQYQSVRLILYNEGLLVVLSFYLLFLLQINNHGFIQGDWFWLFTMIGVIYKRNETFVNGL